LDSPSFTQSRFVFDPKPSLKESIFTDENKDAQSAIAKFKSLDKFTIASKPVFISYIHAGVFVPATGQDDPRFSFSPLANPGIRVSYWDFKGYLRELLVSLRETDDDQDGKATEQSGVADRADAGGFAGAGKDGQSKQKKRKADTAPPGSNKKVCVPFSHEPCRH
jgi:hypothetical protein